MSDLKIITSHPIQYQVHLFLELQANGLKIEVGYYHQGAAWRIAHDVDY